MAKIDTTKIKDFDSLSAEEKVKALLDAEVDDKAEELKELQGKYDKAKEALNKASSDTASYKKALREKESAEETAKREREEAEAKQKAELEELKSKLAIQEYEKKYLELGYSADLAKSTAEAQANGDTEKVFENQQKFVETLKKDMESDNINKQPGVSGGDPNKAPITKEQIMAIKDATERQNAIKENIELFQ